MRRLCGLPLHNQQLKIHTKIKAYTQKYTLQPIRINSWAVYSKETSTNGCYAGYILGAKPPKLALLSQIRSRSKPPTLMLNQTNKPCQEDHTTTWTLKSQSGTFTLLCPVFPAGEHAHLNTTYLIVQTRQSLGGYFGVLLSHMLENPSKSGFKRRWENTGLILPDFGYS